MKRIRKVVAKLCARTFRTVVYALPFPSVFPLGQHRFGEKSNSPNDGGQIDCRNLGIGDSLLETDMWVFAVDIYVAYLGVDGRLRASVVGGRLPGDRRDHEGGKLAEVSGTG